MTFMPLIIESEYILIPTFIQLFWFGSCVYVSWLLDNTPCISNSHFWVSLFYNYCTIKTFNSEHKFIFISLTSLFYNVNSYLHYTVSRSQELSQTGVVLHKEKNDKKFITYVWDFRRCWLGFESRLLEPGVWDLSHSIWLKSEWFHNPCDRMCGQAVHLLLSMCVRESTAPSRRGEGMHITWPFFCKFENNQQWKNKALITLTDIYALVVIFCNKCHPTSQTAIDQVPGQLL